MRTIDLQILGKIIISAAMLIALPLAGVHLSGRQLAPYLEFPPLTRHVEHAAFSGPVFMALAAIISATIAPLALRAWKFRPRRHPGRSAPTAGHLPWWGWLGVVVLAAAWVLAWSRFNWLKSMQAHTFTPLWMAYILVVNALCQKRTGRCLLLAKPGYFLLLFPVSACFWWFFEYLNRFVQNWYYVGPELSPWSYFWFATLPFSTVLPAVLSTCECLAQTTWIRRGFTALPPVSPAHPKFWAITLLLTAGAGLALIGVWPNVLFPLLWLSPLLIVVSLQTLTGHRHLFTEVAAGDWHRAISAAAAALICGIFWEMWNVHSLAKWKYSIPLVHRFQIFEMPILGYAGYLPFGLECIIIGDLVKCAMERD